MPTHRQQPKFGSPPNRWTTPNNPPIAVDPRSVKGDKGEPGPAGPRGPEGPAGPQGDPGQVSQEHLATIIEELWARIGSDPNFRGPPGEQGPQGEQGRDGELPTIEVIVQEVIERLPPVVLQIQDGPDVFTQAKPLGQPIKIKVTGLLRSTGE